MGTSVSESMAKSIKSFYKDELKKKRKYTGSSVIMSFPEKRRG